jgi:DNA-binding NtrC family response regulator
MKILIVEDDHNLQEILAELIKAEIPEAETFIRDNLNDAVEVIAFGNIAGVLTDGTFPTWPQQILPRPWNHPQPNWVGLVGWAVKKHVPIVVLTGAGEVAEHARRVRVPVFMKPLETHAAIARLRELVVPKALRENPVVAEMDAENEKVKSRKLKVERAVES